jgi:hypothetical protein
VPIFESISSHEATQFSGGSGNPIDKIPCVNIHLYALRTQHLLGWRTDISFYAVTEQQKKIIQADYTIITIHTKMAPSALHQQPADRRQIPLPFLLRCSHPHRNHLHHIHYAPHPPLPRPDQNAFHPEPLAY